MFDHTPLCQERNNKTRMLWYDTWPHTCKTCRGYGWREYEDDPSPDGVGLSPGYFTIEEPCTCLLDHSCPRCGNKGIQMDDAEEDLIGSCSHCGWYKQEGGSPAYLCSCPDIPFEEEERDPLDILF